MVTAVIPHRTRKFFQSRHHLAKTPTERAIKSIRESPILWATLIGAVALGVLAGVYYGPELARTIKMHRM